ncbi:D-alanyl-D-alanine carboxypeptidase/D-alanyl-D-alanine endopeptidase [Thiofilum flexile]|uniref:D-alanyl-D-alanine carboxypeptidase/D-alanyl-D-alanine endopeptidase n=1 Tax=Thiofilum flexile TaxID=125627 RepID=UPI000367367D|nr:D-alanyl-D-alanine carboxypeptidase/D-alanyl-D-alanine-endopeptidase [Thiofilum flexile]
MNTHSLWRCSLSLITGLILAHSLAYAKSTHDNSKNNTTEAKSTEATALKQLPEKVVALLQKYKIPASELSILIQEVSASKPLVEYEIDTPRNPASTMKLLTTWTALKVLGPSWRWKTEVWTRGTITNGVLYGDLVLKGYGDPYLIYENFWQLMFDLRAKGLKDIQGNLIIDNSYFDVPEQASQQFDKTPERVYNALPSALMFNFQATRFLLSPNTLTNKVDITTFPEAAVLKIDNQLSLHEGRCSEDNYNPVFVRQSTGTMLIRGGYATECGQQFIMRLMTTPTNHVAQAFRQFWQQLGGTLSGGDQSGTLQASDQLFYTYYSPPLIDQIRAINKWSNNVMTRQLLLTLGAKGIGVPGTTVNGSEVVKVYLNSVGINTQGLVIENGAGLSRDERVTARQMGQMLNLIWHDAYMPEFISSLPLLGEDGTLLKRFRHQALRGQAHLKTGTLNDVTALSGFLLTQSGKQLIIVIQHHGRHVSAGRAVQDALLEWAFNQ